MVYRNGTEKCYSKLYHKIHGFGGNSLKASPLNHMEVCCKVANGSKEVYHIVQGCLPQGALWLPFGH